MTTPYIFVDSEHFGEQSVQIASSNQKCSMQKNDAALFQLRNCGDLHSFKGAGVLAKVIESYWRSRGYAGVVVERFEVEGTREPHFGVRSNIVNGFPPKSMVLG